MCRAAVLIIKPIVFLSRRCGPRRSCLSSLTKEGVKSLYIFMYAN